jgi:hypothetical protein
MKKILITLGLVALGLSGCSSDSSDGGGRVNLGPQIDAMGRPAINTALVNTFASNAARSEAEDEFNTTSNEERFDFVDTMADQLAVYDALVGRCGDNPLTNRASAAPSDGLATGPDRYNFVATVFADDQLYVNGNSRGAAAGQCNQYFSAELGVIGVTGLEADCGGRSPLYDVIQTTYSAVAIGGVTGVDDGIPSDNITQSDSQFPFLSAAVN